jgi:alpha-D-ribose 1-methylphosphonate 5-triphosphate synthase subunit PhnH
MQRETIYDPVFDAQKHYRLLLDAMARPGKINTLPHMSLTPPPGLSATAALIGFALLDADVSFCIEDEDPTMTRYLAVNTSARPRETQQADFVFAGGLASPELVTRMKKGTLSYPDDGATLILDVESLGVDGQPITLTGPGVAGERTLQVNGLNTALLTALQECNTEFPLGIDLILTDPDFHIACIPRSSKIK